MIDALLALQAQVTKTATFNGAAVTFPSGSGGKILYAKVIYSAASNASGNNTVQFSVDCSTDGGTTFLQTQDAPINLSTTAAAGVKWIPFVTPLAARNLATAQIRLTVTIAGTGSTPTITYSCPGISNAAP